MDNNMQQRIEEAIREEILLVPYDPEWASLFEEEADFLRCTLPQPLIRRIEHFGSTAVPGLVAKPIIDILVEVVSLEETRKQIVPILTLRGYDYFWRTDIQPAYAWFIKRDLSHKRTHHLHFVEGDSQLWDRLTFRDYLRQFPEEATRYGALKVHLAKRFPNDRVAYTAGKTEFILARTENARRHFGALGPISSKGL